MLYSNLKFPKIAGRPFFYTNFVQTVDGKVQVKKEGYWPIGSRKDYEVLLELRAYADCLIHGKNLALEFGTITENSLKNQEFIKLRVKLGKTPTLPYYKITSRIKSLKLVSKDLYEKGYRNILVEGGPTLLASFLKENLMGEIFLTIAPKIYGNVKNRTLTLAEGYLFPKESIKKLTLLSVKQLESELYLHYKLD